METLEIPEWDTLFNEADKIYDIPPSGYKSIEEIVCIDPRKRTMSTLRQVMLSKHRAGTVERVQVKRGSTLLYYYRPVVNSLQDRTESVL